MTDIRGSCVNWSMDVVKGWVGRLGLKSVTGRWAVTVQRLGETEVS